MKTGLKIALAIIGTHVALILTFVGIMVFEAMTIKETVITDIADYGVYNGNYDNKSAQAIINSFFPEKIESYFDDPQYSYRARRFDSYAFEAYLEFTIEDKATYDKFVAEYSKGKQGNTFAYDSNFTEYVFFEEFELQSDDVTGTDDELNISYSKVGKMVCCEEEQRIIFWALGVYDGGAVTTDYLSVFFERFDIDARQYHKYLNEEQGERLALFARSGRRGRRPLPLNYSSFIK